MPSGNVFIRSAEFPGNYLRMDGSGVTKYTGQGAGTVDAQSSVRSWETFKLVPLPDHGEGVFAIASTAFNNVYLRLDGSALKERDGSGSGTVNLQYGHFTYEAFRLIPQSDGTIAIQSIQFPKAYLRMAGVSNNKYPGGTVNCQSYVGSYEKFYILPVEYKS